MRIILSLLFTGVVAAVSAAESDSQKLIAILKSNAPAAEKAITCKRLAIYGGKEAVPVLAPLLADERLASWARIALEAIPDPAAETALIDATGKLRGKLLIGVINTLGVRRDSVAIAALIEKLKDADADVASAAAVALGRIGGEPAAAALVPLLATAPAAAEGCILCAEKLKPADAVKLYDAVRAANVSKQKTLEATRGAILARGAAGIPLLVEQLKSEDLAFFNIALRTAREIPGRDVAKALLAAFDQSAPDRQPGLLMALADRGDAEVLPVALKAAKTGTPKQRVMAIGVLERFGNASALPVLLAAAAEEDAELSQAAKLALIRLPDAEVNAGVIAMLKDPEPKTRRLAFDLLTQRHATGAVPSLLKAVQDSDGQVRLASFKAIGDLAGIAELPAILDLLVKSQSPAEIQGAAGAVSAIFARHGKSAGAVSPACGDVVFAAWPKASNKLKLALLRVLRAMGGARALDAVRVATTDADAEIKDAALRALCDWSNAEALPELAQMAKTSAKPTYKILALRGYIRLAGQQEVSAEQKLATLKEAMAMTERNEERKLVLAALGDINTVSSLALVSPHLNSPDLKEEACLAAVSIAERIPKPRPALVVATMKQVVKSTANAKVAKRARVLVNK